MQPQLSPSPPRARASVQATHQLVDVQKFVQSQYDPCYFWKWLSDGTRIDLVMYVDDGYAVDSFSKDALAELDALHRAFTIEVKPARFFLGNNVIVHGEPQDSAL